MPKAANESDLSSEYEEPGNKKRKRTAVSMKKKFLESESETGDELPRLKKPPPKPAAPFKMPLPSPPLFNLINPEQAMVVSKSPAAETVTSDTASPNLEIVSADEEDIQFGFALVSDNIPENSCLNDDTELPTTPQPATFRSGTASVPSSASSAGKVQGLRYLTQPPTHVSVSTLAAPNLASPVSVLPKNSATNANRYSKPVLELVLEQLSEIKDSMACLHSKIDTQMLNHGDDADSEFDEDEFTRPETDEELQNISKRVLESASYKKTLILHLSRVGGQSCSKYLNKMLCELMSDEVALLYSYKGQREKKCFKDLRLKPVFVASFKRNPLTRKTSMAFDVELGIGDWLKRASQRLERKKKNELKLTHVELPLEDESWGSSEGEDTG